MLSNSGHPSVAAMYQGDCFDLIHVEARRNINSNSAERGVVREYLIASV